MTNDQLQNELIIIKHHVDDARKGIEDGDTDYAINSLHDIDEAIDRMKSFLDPNKSDEIDRIADEIDND